MEDFSLTPKQNSNVQPSQKALHTSNVQPTPKALHTSSVQSSQEILHTSSPQPAAIADSINLSVTQLFKKEGSKYAFVSFTDGKRFAEGKIPDCKINTNKGFSSDEISQLEEYLKNNTDLLLEKAGQIDVFKAFLGK